MFNQDSRTYFQILFWIDEKKYFQQKAKLTNFNWSLSYLRLFCITITIEIQRFHSFLLNYILKFHSESVKKKISTEMMNWLISIDPSHMVTISHNNIDWKSEMSFFSCKTDFKNLVSIYKKNLFAKNAFYWQQCFVLI